LRNIANTHGFSVSPIFIPGFAESVPLNSNHKTEYTNDVISLVKSMTGLSDDDRERLVESINKLQLKFDLVLFKDGRQTLKDLNQIDSLLSLVDKVGRDVDLNQ
jgi:hypothetical protein